MSTCNLHETGNATTRRGVTRGVVITSTYTDPRQKLTGISYWAYGYTGNCITRGMTILYFQLTLSIAGTYSNQDSKEPTTTPVRSARADLSTKWSCSITILITFFKNCIFYININYSWLSHHGSPACSTVNNYLPAKSSGIIKPLYVINQKRHLHA